MSRNGRPRPQESDAQGDRCRTAKGVHCSPPSHFQPGLMTTMKFSRRRGIFTLVLTATATLGLMASSPAIGQSEKTPAPPAAAPVAAQVKTANDETAKQWSEEVWTAAMHGDRKALERY